jgi:hypothetical protein
VSDFTPDIPGVGQFFDAPNNGTAIIGTARTSGWQTGTPPEGVAGIIQSYQDANGQTYWRDAGAQMGVPIGASGGEGRVSSGDATGTGPGGGGSGGSSAASSSAALILKQYGLDQLIPIVDTWIRGGMTWDEAQLALYDRSTDAGKIFDQRFPGIRMRQEKGLAPISPAEYVDYEKNAYEYMHAAGLPSGFYDNKDDFTNLIANDVSLNELNTRVTQGFAQVATAPPEVRDAFQHFFGAQGDSALASFFLDPDKALPALEKQVNIAQIGGAGLQQGLNFNLDRATQITDTGISDTQARQAFANIHNMDPLFTNTASESGSLTGEQQGVDAALNLDQGQAKKQIQDRLDQRNAEFNGGGGAAGGGSGFFGLGTAR